MHRNLSSIPRIYIKMSGTVMHSHNPNTGVCGGGGKGDVQDVSGDWQQTSLA